MSSRSNTKPLSVPGSVELSKTNQGSVGSKAAKISDTAGKQPPAILEKEKRSPLLAQGFKLFQGYLHQLVIFLLTAAAVLMACSLRGDIALVTVFIYKSYTASTNAASKPPGTVNTTSSAIHPGEYQPIVPDYLQLPDYYNMKDFIFYLAVGIISSQITFQGMCGFFQLYFYTLKRGKPEEWKCQPHRFLSRANEIHEIVVGTVNMTLAGFGSGILTCWIVNGNYSTIYFDISEYGYTYFFLSFVILFLWIEGGTYHLHALLHIPLLYKHIHKHHHRYHSPTAYSAIAMSPIELSFFNTITISPLFLFPIHGLVYVIVIVYVYYYGMMDHSGIKMTSWFPWQPDTMFHDDHHRYCHVNFGLNSTFFDWLYGTMRLPNREYFSYWGGGREKQAKE